MTKQISSLHVQLNEKGYICDERFALGISHALTTKPIGGAFLFGPAGTGKSYLPMMLADILKRKLFFFQCSPGTREDDLVLKMLPSEKTKSGITIEESVVFESAVKSKSEEVILVLDEWDKTRPTADGFFLDFLQYGRLSIPGRSIRANLDNMLIFFTSNNERDISEALLRRFPKVDVNPLGLDVVNKALSMTHDGHPHIGNALSLYHRTLQSGMTKPATIQEIRQLLDAVTHVLVSGNECDWDELVYMYVTKTPENHELLRKAMSKDIEESVVNDRTAIDVSAFGLLPTNSDNKKSSTGMPKLIDVRQLDSSFNMDKSKVKTKDITCMLEYNDTAYTESVLKAISNGGLTDNPADLHWVHVSSGAIVSGEAHNLSLLWKYSRILCSRKSTGEIMFVEPFITYNDMVALMESVKVSNIIIKKAINNEVIGKLSGDWRAYEVDFRWSAESGFEIIIPANKNAFYYVTDLIFSTGRGSVSWYTHNEDTGHHLSDKIWNSVITPYLFTTYGEMTLKSTVGNKYYADYTFAHAPTNNEEYDCPFTHTQVDALNDGPIVFKTPIKYLESISSKVERKVTLVRYTGKGYQVTLNYGRNSNNIPKSWSVKITGKFDVRMLIALNQWFEYETGVLPMYVSINAPGFAIGDELCDKHKWKRTSQNHRVIHDGNTYCVLYDNVMTFICHVSLRKMNGSVSIKKADTIVGNTINLLSKWKQIGSSLGK